MPLRRVACLLLVLSMFVPGRRNRAAAQAPIARAAIGGAVGVVEGAVVSLAVMVAQARFGDEYVESPADVFSWGWKAVPVVVAPVVGLTFGLAGEDAFRGSLLGSASGMAIGATVGGLIGKFTSGSKEATWAGAIMGAGAGLTVGRLLFGVLNWKDDDDDSDSRAMSLVFRITP